MRREGISYVSETGHGHMSSPSAQLKKSSNNYCTTCANSWSHATFISIEVHNCLGRVKADFTITGFRGASESVMYN